MKHHAFWLRAAVAAAGAAILLISGTATGAMAAVTSTSAPSARQDSGPSRPTGLIARARHGAVVLSWSPPAGGLKAGDGYLIYMGTSSGQEGGKPSVPYLIQSVTSYTVAPLKDGTRYYFQVALLDAGNRVSARSAEVSAVPGAGTGSAAGPATAPPASPGAPAGSGVNANAQPGASPLRGRELAQHRTSPSRPTGLVVLLVAVVLAAAAGGVTAVMLLRRYSPGARTTASRPGSSAGQRR